MNDFLLANGFFAEQGKTILKQFVIPITIFDITSDRLVYYLHPTDFELRKLAGIPQPKPKAKPKEGEKKRGKNKRKWEEPVEEKTFNIPRNLDFQVVVKLITVFQNF